mmetsp:Transcript_23593/g.52987  ORF Transcript_23593/g.52987 Transcript_23593/m.52987 type:complete len:231 (+) Transcript_23593:851-1543(+)
MSYSASFPSCLCCCLCSCRCWACRRARPRLPLRLLLAGLVDAGRAQGDHGCAAERRRVVPDLAVEAAHVAAHERVPVVLHVVVCAAGQALGDLGPLIAQFLVRFGHDPLLLLCPVGLVDMRVEVVVPALAALLARAARDAVLLGEVLGDKGPALGAVLGDHGADGLVLVARPHPPVRPILVVVQLLLLLPGGRDGDGVGSFNGCSSSFNGCLLACYRCSGHHRDLGHGAE